jgi:hypothetical protein
MKGTHLVRAAFALSLMGGSIPFVCAATNTSSKHNASTELSKIYDQKVMRVIHAYGIYSGNPQLPALGTNTNQPVGLAYAKLVRFDKDSRKELLILYIDKNERVTYEVWNGNARLAIGGCSLGGGVVNDDEISLVQTQGRSYLHWVDGGHGAGGGGTTNYFFTVSKGKWVTAATIRDTYTWNPEDTSPTDTYTVTARA